IVNACLAEACSFSTSPSCRFSFISSCRWLPMTEAACWESAWCWRCASSMACWICTLGSACSSTFDENDAIRYFQNFENGLAISSACLLLLLSCVGHTAAGRARFYRVRSACQLPPKRVHLRVFPDLSPRSNQVPLGRRHRGL